MNKLFLWIAVTAAVVGQSCEKTEDIRAELDSLRDRITALETQVGDVNRNIATLQKLMDASTVIVGQKQTPTGYELQLSDGTTLSITQGEKLDALVPVMAIDKDGFWIYSIDNGVSFKLLLVDGKPVSAWPLDGGKPTENATGTTPRLKIDTDGYWMFSTDGVKYDYLLQGGEKVNAVGDKATVSHSSFFKSVTYNELTGMMEVELLTGDKLMLAVQDTFSLIVTANASESFSLGEIRVFEVVQKNVAEALLSTPEGWSARLDETTLTVTAPTAYKVAAKNATLSIAVVSKEHYRKVTTLEMTLLNQQVDASSCEAWRNFKAGTAQNVLLDFSYAGYKRGEEAPADGWAWGYKVYNVVDYGADPSGVKSSREAFLKLLKELRLSGQSTTGASLANANAQAVIYFPEGRYILHNDDDNVYTNDASWGNKNEFDSKGNNKSEEIFIRGGNFVIKGDGRDKTTLVMDSPNLPNNSSQMWSSPMMINIKNNAGTSKVSEITADAAQGAFSVEVGSVTGVSTGDWVLLKLSNNDPALVAQELAPHIVEGNMSDIKKILIEDYHQVKSVRGSTVTFYEPLFYKVEAKWKWELHKYPHYENVGVEDLAFEGRSKENFGHHLSWQDDGAYKPLNMMRLTNSWLRRVDFRNVSEAATIVSSANCSAYDIDISGNRGHAAVRSQSSSRIFIGKINDHSSGRECTTSNGAPSGPYLTNAGQYHASGVSNTSLGAVLWNNTWGDDAFFESHSRQPRATLVDRCTGGFVQWRFGGDDTNVPNHLRDLTIWNLNATVAKHDFGSSPFQWWLSNDRWWKTMPPTIVGFHGAAVNFDTDPAQTRYLESNGTAVEPQSLYEAQLRTRLGYVPAWLNSLK